MRAIWLLWASILIIAPVQAHNVIAGAYVEGMTVEGEIAFSDGGFAQAGVLVEVLDSAGNKLGETHTEEEGLFSFVADTAVQHTFKADLGAGHIANIVVEADEFSPDTKTAAKANNAASKASTGQQAQAVISSPANTLTGLSADELESIIRRAVAQQVKPLQKELRAYKEKVMLRDIAGGLGFIFGLFGVAAWVAARKSKPQQD